MANQAPKSAVTSPAGTQAQNLKNLGGMPEKKGVDAIMKTNTPSARSAAPDSFRPK